MLTRSPSHTILACTKKRHPKPEKEASSAGEVRESPQTGTITPGIEKLWLYRKTGNGSCFPAWFYWWSHSRRVYCIHGDKATVIHPGADHSAREINRNFVESATLERKRRMPWVFASAWLGCFSGGYGYCSHDLFQRIWWLAATCLANGFVLWEHLTEVSLLPPLILLFLKESENI